MIAHQGPPATERGGQAAPPAPSPGPLPRQRLRRRSHGLLRGNTELSRRLIVLAVGLSAMGLGGLHWTVLLLCAALGITAGVLALEAVPARRAVYGPALVLLALAAYTAFQCVPLPMGLARWLSPSSADVWARALIPFGDQPARWATLSMDRGATLVEAARYLTYAGVMVAAIVAGARQGPGWGGFVLFVAALAVGGTTLVHGFLELSSVYGLYRPMFPPGRWHVGPLLNANNLAGYLNLGLLAGLGLTLSRRSFSSRAALGLGVASLAGMVAISGSRAGVVALLVGLGVFGVCVFRAPASERRAGVIVPAFGAVGGAALLAWLGSSQESLHQLFDKNIEKLEVMPYVAPLVRDHLLFGVGRGAFESVFPAYHVGSLNVYFAYPENFVLQWLAEWGFPIGALTAAGFVWVVLHGRNEARESFSAAGIWAGLIAIMLQNLLDLAFEIPGVAVATVFGIGTLWGRAHRREIIEISSKDAPLVDPRWRAGGVVAFAPLALLVFAYGRDGVTADRLHAWDALRKAEPSSPTAVAEARQELRTVMARHPADPYFPRLGGVLAFVAKDQSPFPWLARSLERGMTVGETHLVLAKVLASVNARTQALLELKLAVTYRSGLSQPAATAAMALAGTFDELAAVVPGSDAAGAAMLEVLAANAVGRSDAGRLREQCLQAALERAPESISVRLSLVNDRLAAVRAGDAVPACAGERRSICLREIDEHINAVFRLAPQAPTALVLKARVLVALGRARDGEELLRKGCVSYVDEPYRVCAEARVEAAVASHSRALLAAASKDLTAAGCNSSVACGNLMSFLGSQAAALGDLGGALIYYQKAVTEDPTEARWENVAAAASALGEHVLAVSALKELVRSRPGDAALTQRLKEETRASIVESFKR